MAEVVKEVVEQVKETPKTIAKSVRHTPVLALLVAFSAILAVLIVEAFKPGVITGPFKSFLRKLGFKGAV